MDSSVSSSSIDKSTTLPDDPNQPSTESDRGWATNLRLPAYASTPEGVTAVRLLAAKCAATPDSLCARAQCADREAVPTMSAPELVAHILTHHVSLYRVLFRRGVVASTTACPWADCGYELRPPSNLHRLHDHFVRYHSRSARRCYLCREFYESNAELRRHPCIRDAGADADLTAGAATHLSQWSVRCPWCTHEEVGFGRVQRPHVMPRMVEHAGAAHARSDVVMCITCIACMTPEEETAHRRGACPGRKCPKCEYRSRVPTCFRHHVRIKHTAYGRRCDGCGVMFASSRKWADHACLEGGVLRRHQCDLCPRSYASRQTLRIHRIDAHRASAMFTCAHCGKVCTTSRSLTRHVSDVHEKERQHECPVCEQKFSQKSSMRRHMLIHLKMKPHLCQHCGDSFRQRTLLLHHMKKEHPGEPVE